MSMVRIRFTSIRPGRFSGEKIVSIPLVHGGQAEVLCSSSDIHGDYVESIATGEEYQDGGVVVVLGPTSGKFVVHKSFIQVPVTHWQPML